VTSAIETNLSIITASAPALWPLARRWFPSIFRNLGLSRNYVGHISDIETADAGLAMGKLSKIASKRSNRWLQHFQHNHRRELDSKEFVDKGRVKCKGGAHNLFASRTIGGSSFAEKSRGDGAGARTEITRHDPSESEVEFMTYDGIMMTTKFGYSRDGDSRQSLRTRDGESRQSFRTRDGESRQSARKGAIQEEISISEKI